MGHVRHSVYYVSPRSLVIAFAGLGLVLLPAIFARQLITKQGSRGGGSRVNALDKLAIGQASQTAEVLSNVGTTIGVGIPFAVDWFDTRGEKKAFLEDAVVVAEALALNGALNTAVKYTVQRPLPETYAGVVPNRQGNPRGYRAFYSGHVSTLAAALAAASITVRMRHGRLPWHWPWLVSSVLAVFVGLGRIFSGKHFPTDVLVGAPIGAAIGATVPLLHAREGARERAWARQGGKRRWRAALRRAN
jgi:membrane-associated phospholipid phosphatase